MSTPTPERAVGTSTSAPPPPSSPVARLAGTLPVVAAFVALAIGVLVTQETYESVQTGRGAAAFDEPVRQWMVAQRTPWLDTAATWFTNLGGKVGMTALATVTVLALARWWRTWTPVLLMVCATAGSLTLTALGKELTARARPPAAQAVPPLETSASFPSGHTLNAVLVTAIIGYLVLLHVRRRRARVITWCGLALFATLIGLSRIYLGHHWLTDVIAGAAVGGAWAMAVILGHRVYLRRARRPATALVSGRHTSSL